nr:hypothetical protein [Armatimonas sp.]
MSIPTDHQVLKSDPNRLRMLAIYDELPVDLRPALLAGLELVASHFSGTEPRPGASDQNRRIVTEAIAQARESGQEPLAELLKGWLDPKRTFGAE